jgi:Tfp pilus assembly protein PilF
VYESAIRERPAGFEALTGLGFCQLGRKDFLLALSSFRAALGSSATYADAVFGMAETYRLQGSPSFSDATLYYGRYLEQAPSGPRAPLC